MRISITFRIGIICLIVCFSAILLKSAAASPGPTEQLRPFINKINLLLSSPDIHNQTDAERTLHINQVAQEGFDFREMSKRVLGKHWKKLSKDERVNFIDLFSNLLQIVYLNKIQDYSDTKIEYTRQRIKGKRAEVQTLLIDSDRSIPVSYIMINKENKWMIYDVVVEGISLVRNYLEQFREILRKDDFDHLTHQLEQTIARLQDTTPSV